MKHRYQAGVSDRFRSDFQGQFRLARAFRLGTSFVALITVGLALAIWVPSHAAQPSVHPLVIAGRWTPPPLGITLHVAVEGDYAYIAGWLSDLHVIDVRNPGHPVRVGGYNFGINWETSGLAVSGGYAFVTDDEGGGMAVIDVSNSTNCVRIGGYGSNMEFTGVQVSGNYAYLLGGLGGGLQVIDVRNPSNCIRVGGITTPGQESDVALFGNYAYLADGSRGLQVIDVSNRTNCIQIGSDSGDSGFASAVAVSGNYAYVTRSLREISGLVRSVLEVFDVSDPSDIERVGRYVTSADVGRAALAGDYAYLTTGMGLEVIDVRVPTNCVRVGSYEINDRLSDITVVAGRIYLAGETKGLLVLPSVPDFQLSLRIDGTPGIPFTLEAAPDLSVPNPWSPLLTTNVSSMPFDYVDYDVKLSENPRKFYRVHQP